jgi:hypothetical protein
MNVKLSYILPGMTACALIGAGLTLGQALSPETQTRAARVEKSPSAIDVSKYPQRIRNNYQLFAQECSYCHRLSRPINSQLALPDEWSRCIRRMMNKPGSGIGPGDGKKIYEFLVYDSSIRKRAALDEKLAKATPAEKAAALAKVKEVRDKYGH